MNARILALATFFVAASVSSVASAGDETTRVAPAPEKKVDGSSEKVQLSTFKSTVKGAAGRPTLNGRKIDEATRARMKATIDQRIEKNVQDIRGLRNEAAGLLESFVKESTKDTPDLPEALMRLGELRWEIERETAVDRFDAWEKKPVDQRGPAPEPNFEPSRALFQRVLSDYPRHKEYDLALYIDGFLATEQGRPEEALTRFERIIKEFPKSRFIPDAHMSRAEALFAKTDYPGALAAYEEVLKFKKSDLYGLAMFKSAWCMWRLGRTDEAAKRFVSVFEVAEGKAADVSQQKQLDELQAESLKYLVEVFTEDDKNSANDVYNFLTRIGGDRFAGKVVKALAEQFFDQAHYERGIEAYELLIKLDPTNRDAGLWMLRMAEGLNLIEDWPRLKVMYERLVKDYTTGGSWSKTQADQTVVAETTTRIEAQLRENALNLHAKAQKDKSSRAEFDGARGLYAVYLSRFSSEPKSYQVAYYAAEIEFYHLGQNSDAATHYMMAARGVPEAEAQKEPLKTLRHDALFNAIASLERVRIAELEAKKNKPAGAKEESEIDAKFAEALDLYAQLYPNDPSLPELFFRQGKLYYDYGVYDPAVKIWGALVEKFPRSPQAQGAGELLLDSFNKSKNYENIELWARRLKGVPAFQTPAQQEKLNLLIVQAVFKQGEQKGLAGDHAGAATAYLRAAKEFPKDSRAAQACVNAELEAQKAGDLRTLKEAATLVIGPSYRERPEAPQGAWIAVTTFQAMGLFQDAAEFSEGLVASAEKGHTKNEHTKDAAFNAVLLRAAVGDNDKAVANGNKYLASFGTTAEADEVVFQMGRAHQRAGRQKEAIELYRRYLPKARNQDHRAQGYVLLAEAQIKSGDEKGADESLRAAVQIGKQKKGSLGPDGKYAAAHARYMEGERVLAKFAKVQIEGDVKQLSKRLKEKAELLKSAATIFLDTVSLGVAEWSTAALYQIGFTYESFAKALRDAPPPSGLSEADKEAYQQQIDEFVVPIEEKSLDAYENGWKKAIDLGIYNQWTAKMRDSLGRLNGELYRPFKEVGFEVRSSSGTNFPALFDAPHRGPQAKPDPKADAKKTEEKKTDEAKGGDDNPYGPDPKKPEGKTTEKKAASTKKKGKGK